MRNIIFADNIVGLKCLDFLLQYHKNDIVKIIVTDENSIVYKKYKNSHSDLVIFNKDLINYDFKSIDYIFLIWWPYLIKNNVMNIAKKGVVNTHPSFLPYNRGKHYNFWNLIEDVPFGVSLHFVTTGIDSGDIIFQKKIDVTWESTGETLYKSAQNEMYKLFKNSYQKILNNDFIRKKQNLKDGTYHNASELDEKSEIYLEKNYTAKDLLNLLRARTFPPHPSCYFFDERGEKYEVEIKIKRI